MLKLLSFSGCPADIRLRSQKASRPVLESAASEGPNAPFIWHKIVASKRISLLHAPGYGTRQSHVQKTWQEHLRAEKDANFTSCSEKVARVLAPDVMKSVVDVLPDLLENYPLLLYQGQ